MKGILLFDIDGTLINSSSSEEPVHHTVMKLRGCSQFPSARESSGLTDWALLSLINSLNEEKVGIEDLELCFAELDEAYLRKLEKVKLSKCFGVSETNLKMLAHEFELGILTGNTERRAHSKIERVGINSFFNKELVFSAKARESRDELAMRVRNRYLTTTQNVFVAGDTPKDIAAARNAGLASIGIATGKFTLDELIQFLPDLAVSNLEEGVTQILNLLISRK